MTRGLFCREIERPVCGLSRPSFSYFADAAFVYTRGTFCSALHHLSPDRSFAKVVSIRTKNVFSLQTDPANDPVDKAPMLCRVGILLRPSFCRSVHCSPRTTIQYQPLRLALKSRWAHSSQVILAFTKGPPTAFRISCLAFIHAIRCRLWRSSRLSAHVNYSPVIFIQSQLF